LAGDPGLGKSLVTLDIAARVSRGVDWPDGARGLGRAGSVVLLSGEDHLQQTILPRLEGMGADMSRLVTVEPRRDALRGEDSSQFELDRDMDELRRTVNALGDCALIVLDPISAFLGRTGECSNADVRRLLAPLAELARQRQVAVLFVVHLRKDMGPAVRRALVACC
jgi:RecA-family ATPase